MTYSDDMGAITTTLHLGRFDQNQLLNHVINKGATSDLCEQAVAAQKLSSAGWIISADSDGNVQAMANHDFASWDVAAAFLRSLGLSGYTLEWEPENQWDYDPVSWPIDDPARCDVEDGTFQFK